MRYRAPRTPRTASYQRPYVEVPHRLPVESRPLFTSVLEPPVPEDIEPLEDARPDDIRPVDFAPGGIDSQRRTNIPLKPKYNIENPVEDRDYNCNTAAVGQLCDVVATLIRDLSLLGILRYEDTT